MNLDISRLHLNLSPNILVLPVLSFDEPPSCEVEIFSLNPVPQTKLWCFVQNAPQTQFSAFA